VALPTIGFLFGPGMRSIVFTNEEHSHLWCARNSSASRSSKIATRKASIMASGTSC
jgi:hypothetical protein